MNLMNLFNNKTSKLTFYFAECMEFTSYGEFHDELTLEEALSYFKKIPGNRRNAQKCIGFVLEDGSDYDGVEQPIMTSHRVLRDEVNSIAHYRKNPEIQLALEQAEEWLSKNRSINL